MLRRALLGLCAVTGVAAGLSCSAIVTETGTCENDRQCQDAFGWGVVCNDETGFCEDIKEVPLCQTTIPMDLWDRPEAYRDRYLMGALFGPEAHSDSVMATLLAVEKINEEGLDGRQFALVICSTDGAPGPGGPMGDALTPTRDGARFLAEMGASAIVGPRGSSRTEAAFNAVRMDNVLVISPSATSPALSQLDNPAPSDEMPGLLWRTVPPDTAQAEAIVQDVANRNSGGSVAILAQTGSYGDALSELLEAGFDGQDVAADVTSFDGSPAASVAELLDDEDIEEVVFISSDIDDYVAFLNAATANDELTTYFEARGIFLTDTAFNQDLLDGPSAEAQELFGSVRGSRPAPAEGSLFNEFSAEFKARFGTDPESSGFTVHTYDATWLVAYAFAWAQSNEQDLGGRSLARGLRRMSDGADTPIRAGSYADVASAFAAGDGIDVRGGSGELDYDPATEETTAPIELWQIVDEGDGPMFETIPD